MMIRGYCFFIGGLPSAGFIIHELRLVSDAWLREALHCSIVSKRQSTGFVPPSITQYRPVVGAVWQRALAVLKATARKQDG